MRCVRFVVTVEAKCSFCSRNLSRPHAEYMFSGFSGFLPHVVRLSRLFSAPEAFMVPVSKAGVGGGGLRYTLSASSFPASPA